MALITCGGIHSGDAPPLVSDPEVVKALTENFKKVFGSSTEEMKLDMASDDFPNLAPEGVP